MHHIDDERPSVPENYTEISVNNIPMTESMIDLQKLFRRLGSVKEIQLTMRKGKHKLYGRVSFIAAEQAKRAVERLNTEEAFKPMTAKPYKELAARIAEAPRSMGYDEARETVPVYAKMNTTKTGALDAKSTPADCEKRGAADTQDRAAHISNLGASVSNDTLVQLFAPYFLTKATVMRRQKYPRVSRGFALVEFDTPENLRKAMREKNGAELHGRCIEITKMHTRS
ncbi:hypothetical protein MVES_002609 [Malassezia vespertilionis]|uniref:RRM domain-containing protein n=1 Tax=Malassezia vespertilionis TaxID=2020962 RepID=A0A2N1JAP9_9BASI|nr:hypothetical protein MVES_002609 [Malassezia vespertilionis]